MLPTPFEYELTHALDVPEIAPLPAIRSERAATVARWFGIESQLTHGDPSSAQTNSDHRADRAVLRTLLPRCNQITFLTGPSGAGKSSMLRALRRLRPRAVWLDLNAIELPNVPIVDCFDGAPLDQTLALLSQVGLAEAWSYLRTPAELSEGQRWRLKLAIAMRRAPQQENRLILLLDEFAALLDRVTALIVARCLRRAVSATPKLCAIVATSHEDLTRALLPDVLVHCDFRRIEVRRRVEADSGELQVRKTKRKRRRKRRRETGLGTNEVDRTEIGGQTAIKRDAQGQLRSARLNPAPDLPIHAPSNPSTVDAARRLP